MLHAYSDVDRVECPDDRRSPTGYCVYLCNNLVSWSSKKHVVARSITKAEYRALANTTAEIRWLMSLVKELRISLTCPPNLWYDNIGATYLDVNAVFHQRTKHLEIDLDFVHDMVMSNQLSVCFLLCSNYTKTS